MNNYKEVYSQYWMNKNRWGSHSFDDVNKVCEEIITVCGIGKTLDVGCGMGLLVKTMVKKGVDAYGMDVAENVVLANNEALPGRFKAGSALSMPYDDNSFQTVVSTDCLEHIAEDDIQQVISEMYRVTNRYLYVKICTTIDRDNKWHLCVHGRDWWEDQFFKAGFRKHPRYYTVINYESLEGNARVIDIVLEKVNIEILGKYPLNVLQVERELHMDMCRETGRRSDAHIIRYQLASQFIRKGDNVLDIACGLGYGSSVLRSMKPTSTFMGMDNSKFAIEYARDNYGNGITEFQQGDAENLEVLSDNLFDTIVSFETLEHLHNPQKFLENVSRILRPSGRFIVSVPNDWTDETGNDPNPHHHHVYNWSRLKEELQKNFLLEKAYRQIAGGGMKLTDNPRTLVEIDVNNTEQIEPAEWYILVAMKDPTKGIFIPYQETIYSEQQEISDCNVVAIKRDYLNPWLVRGMVSIGLRNENKDVLNYISKEVLRMSPASSVDRGAALCVRAYDILNSYASAKSVLDMIALIDEFTSSVSEIDRINNIHTLRWTVSLLNVKAHLLMKTGYFLESKEAFIDCINADAVNYSPLLLSKTVDACFWAGIHELRDNNISQATQYWQTGLVKIQDGLVKSNWNSIWGSTTKPLDFALGELENVLQKGARCAFALNAINYIEQSPGYFWTEISRDFETQFEVQSLEIRRLNQAVDEYERLKKDWYEPEIHRLNQAVAEYEKVKKEWHEPEIERLNKEIERMKNEISKISFYRIKKTIKRFLAKL